MVARTVYVLCVGKKAVKVVLKDHLPDGWRDMRPREDERALDAEQQPWLPLSQIECESEFDDLDPGDTVEVRIPEWLAEERGFA